MLLFYKLKIQSFKDIEELFKLTDKNKVNIRSNNYEKPAFVIFNEIVAPLKMSKNVNKQKIIKINK